jgi:2,4-dienoyl-CoA reductase-like NADH-dependent reductase (Old Yellow Enzyme family)
MSIASLLTPYRLAGLELRNRIVMAPMTRNRAGERNAPTGLNATYYAQRVTLGPGTYYGGDHRGYTDYPTLDDDLEEVA